MRKDIFLKQLRYALRNRLSNDEIEKVIEHYDNYFAEESELGKTSRQIVNEFGSAAALAAIICDSQESVQESDAAAAVVPVIEKEGVEIYSLSTEIQELKFNVINAAVNIIFTDDTVLALYVNGKDLPNQQDYSIISKNNQLSFNEHHSHHRLLHAKRRYKHYTINCYVPAVWAALTIKATAMNGKIRVIGKENSTSGKINFSTINGSLYVSNLNAAEISFNTVNGAFNIENSLFNIINIKSVNNHSFINFRKSPMGARLKCKAVNCAVSVNGHNLMQGSINGMSNLVLFHGSEETFIQVSLITINGSLTVSH
jgi:hypothetical protein